jgi:hypothetical protein
MLHETTAATRWDARSYPIALFDEFRTQAPKNSRAWVRAVVHSVCDQSDTNSIRAQYVRVVDALSV